MKREWKKAYGIHFCCALLVIAFIAAVPAFSSVSGPGSSAGATAGGNPVGDPLGRLPSSPEEAQQRLAERDIAWPEAPAGEFGAAAVIEGVQSGVRVAIPFDSVEGFVTHAGASVKVELWRSAVKQGEVVKVAGSDGWFKADLSGIAGGIQSGDTVRVTDLAGGATADIDCTLTANIDFTNDRASGLTIGNGIVDAYIVAPSTYYADIPPGAAHRQVTAAVGGAYVANFPGLDVRRGDAAYVFCSNPADGHIVMNAANGSGDCLVVYPQYDDVMGYYIPGTALTVKAGSVTRDIKSEGDGFFEAWFSDFDIKDGTEVSCNMGGERSVIVRDVTAKCDPAANTVAGKAPANAALRLTMDPYGTPVIYKTTSNAAGDFSVSLGAAYTATGTDVYNVTVYDPDGDCVVYEFQTYSWYLAEGYTGGTFDTWVLVQNPGTLDDQVVLTFQLPPGHSADPYYLSLPAGTRMSVHLDELPGLADTDVSTKVTSTTGNWIIAERAEYYDYSGNKGGHDSIGTLTPSTTWYLAEGYTGGTFSTWVLVQNPGTEDANVTFKFQLPPGHTAKDFSFKLPAGTRKSVQLDELEGLADTDVSTKVISDKPVVAERAEYFNYLDTFSGGHCSVGVIAPSTTWYLAEGYTGGTFSTWVLVQNPGTEDANVTFKFQLPPGHTAKDFSFKLPAGTRKSVQLDELEGLADTDVSTKVISDKPVVAERAEYFNYLDTFLGGHDSIGTNSPETTWYLAEGYTGGTFSTWVLVQNPGTEDANVTFKFQLPPGHTAKDFSFKLPAGTRKSFQLDEIEGLADTDVSTKVISDKPVVAERAEYFNYFGNSGGHCSIGVPEILGY